MYIGGKGKPESYIALKEPKSAQEEYHPSVKLNHKKLLVKITNPKHNNEIALDIFNISSKFSDLIFIFNLLNLFELIIIMNAIYYILNY